MYRTLFFIALVATAAASPEKPPSWTEKAKFARWMTSSLTWGTMSTISTMAGMQGTPLGNPVSIADNGTGVPYMCVSPLGASIIDLAADSRMSLSLSEAQMSEVSACQEAGSGDPENPPCARLVLSGSFVNITGTPEAEVATV